MTVQRAVIIFPNSKTPWKGRITEAGVEQSLVEITEGPEMHIGRVQAFPNGDLKYDRKKSGPIEGEEYDRPRAGTKTREKPMNDQAEGATNHKDQYNSLVEQAVAIGLTDYKPITTRFRDAATGAKRCEALAEAIEAHRAKVADEQPPQPAGEEATEPPPSRGEKMAKTAKKKGKGKAAKKAAAPKVAAKKVSARGNGRDGVVAEFGTREGTNREKLLLALNAKRNKPVKLDEVAKAVYGSGGAESRGKLKAVIIGLNVMIEEGKLPYKRVEYEGRGDDATVMLAHKSGR